MDEGRQAQTFVDEVAPAQRHIIKRPRLYRLLDESNARIILLVAPAGYGKTTLARQWTGLRGRTGLWLRATSADADPAALARNIAITIASEFPAAKNEIDEFLVAASRNPHAGSDLAEVLAGQIERWPPSVWLVLDDYQTLISSDEAEDLVRRLAEIPNLHLMLTSRDAPSWMSARHVLYGDALELGADILAMTSDEVAHVVGPEKSPSELERASNGWPALIGLAALAPSGADLTARPEALHRYFATELLDRVDATVRTSLPRLSLVPAVDMPTAREIWGDTSDLALQEAVRVGLGSWNEGFVEVHPLVRGFLRTELERNPPSRDLVERLTRHLIREGRDQAAVALIDAYDLANELVVLVDARLIPTLEAGLSATVSSWIELGHRLGVDSAELSLARAQLLLNRGEWVAAQTTASACAPLLRGALRDEAYICAGISAQLLDDTAASHEYFRSALEATASPKVVARALWGEFLLAVHFPDGDPLGALARLEAHADSSPAHLIRLTQARIVTAEHDGEIARACDGATHAEVLLEDVADPLIRTGFLNNLADACVLSARYADAERLVRSELRECERFKLEFVRPHAMLILAASKLGQGDFLAASALMDEVENLPEPRDSFVDANLVGLRAVSH